MKSMNQKKTITMGQNETFKKLKKNLHQDMVEEVHIQVY